MITVVSKGGSILTLLLFYSKILELQNQFFLLLHTAYGSCFAHCIRLYLYYFSGHPAGFPQVQKFGQVLQKKDCAEVLWLKKCSGNSR